MVILICLGIVFAIVGYIAYSKPIDHPSTPEEIAEDDNNWRML